MNVKFMNVLSILKMNGDKVLVQIMDQPNVPEMVVQMIVLVLGVVKILSLTLLKLSNTSIPTEMDQSTWVIISLMNT